MTHPSARPFTAKELETIKTMWEQGHSGSQIGAALKRSRCSILGKLSRLGIRGGRATVHIQRLKTVPKVKKQNSGADATRQLHYIRNRKEIHERIAAAAKTLPKSRIVPGSVPVTLFERTGCCFPVNEGGMYLFCDMPLHGHKSYCTAHLPYMTAARVAA